jgi:hypothetical protein
MKDKQLIELIGKARFTEFAIRSGFELATPFRDKGIDCLMYFPVEDNLFNTALPIQLKCYTAKALTVDSKYDRMGNILHVIIWNCMGDDIEYFALTQKHAMELAVIFKWNDLPGWKSKHGRYDATKATPRIKAEMMQYKIETETFKERVRRYYNL